MIIKNAFSAVFLLLSFYANAQKVSYKTGPAIVDERSWMIKQIFAKNQKQIYVFNMGTDMSQLECFNAETLESIYKRTISIPYLRTSHEFTYTPQDLFLDHNMFYYNDKVVYLSAWFNKKEKTNNVIGQTFKSNDGSESNQATKIITDPIDKKRDKGSEYPKYTFYQSTNAKNILVIKHYDYENTFYYKVLDFDLNVVNEGELITTALASDFEIDGEGNLFYLLSSENPESNKKSDAPAYNYKLFSLNFSSKVMTEYEIGTKEKNITNIKYKLEGTQILVSGFTNSAGGIDNIFYSVIDKVNHKLITTKESPLENALPDHGLKMEIIDFTTKSNGGVYVVTEQRETYSWITKTTKTYNPYALGVNDHPVTFRNQSPTHHAAIFYGDIFVFSLEIDYTLSWERKIEKSQKLNFDSGYASFGYIVKGEEIVLLHNEIGQPVSLMFPYIPKGITVNSFSKKGENENYIIGADDLDKLAAKPAFALKNNSEMFVQSKLGKSQVLTKISK